MAGSAGRSGGKAAGAAARGSAAAAGSSPGISGRPSSPSCSNNFSRVCFTSLEYFSITIISAFLSADSRRASASTIASLNKLDINLLLKSSLSE